jgi:hypothetical protein
MKYGVKHTPIDYGFQHKVTMSLGNQADLAWAQRIVTEHHYLRQPVDPRARPMVYVVRYGGIVCGLVMFGIPHATKCGKWWGYPGLPTQWQCVDLNRIWLSPVLQMGGHWCQPGIVPGYTDRKGIFRPTVATWAIREVLQRVQADRVRLWPPVYPSQPYHILLAISYHDPAHHRGTIYRQSGAMPMYVDSQGNAVPGSAGKFGWCWRLAEPAWSWEGLDDIKPRTMRMEFA